MKISVYITSFNQKEFLKEAIESVLDQTLQPFELLIIDDASTDGSDELISEYQAKFPHLIKKHFNHKNLGITKCRNRALSLVQGDYVTALDGDDVFLPKKLEIQASLIKKYGADAVYSNFYYAHDYLDNNLSLWCEENDLLPNSTNQFVDVLARNFPKATLFRNELMKVSIVELLGGYDESLPIYEDFDFRIRLAKNASLIYTYEPLCIYRLHGHGLSRAPKDEHFKALSYIYNKYENEISKLTYNDQLFINQHKKYVLGLFQKPSTPKNVSLFHRINRRLIKFIKDKF